MSVEPSGETSQMKMSVEPSKEMSQLKMSAGPSMETSAIEMSAEPEPPNEKLQSEMSIEPMKISLPENSSELEPPMETSQSEMFTTEPEPHMEVLSSEMSTEKLPHQIMTTSERSESLPSNLAVELSDSEKLSIYPNIEQSTSTSVENMNFGTLQIPSSVLPKPTIQVMIERACNPQLREPDLALDLEIADLINQKKQNYPRDAAFHIVKLVNHRNPTVGLSALTLLDICVKNCGYPFHLQIATTEFLNELVKSFPEKPPAIPNPIQLRILEFILEWKSTICATSRHKDDLHHIDDMYRLLLYKGYMFPELDGQSAAVLHPTETLKSPDELEEEDRAAQAAKLQELIRRGTPADLEEANELMKVMAGYDPEQKPDYKKQVNEELERVQRKTILLKEMLNNVKPGENIGNGDVFEDLVQSCKVVQPKIQKFISEEDDSESIERLLNLNDLINTVLKKYEDISNGIFKETELSPPPPPPSTNSASESWLIDLGDDEQPQGQGQIKISDDLIGITSVPNNEQGKKGPVIDDLLGLSFN
ncbi:17205_t:CDS:10 [Acaulospora morrowiae]|uniref:17205_t:CDS:1 n=1 Tax=Acaulospora morrowiae TaxID=94023 RepID=A0A9N8WT07_9GLOM|nr:17205_t:CDS:10 [Acaulospora morrowiae]